MPIPARKVTIAALVITGIFTALTWPRDAMMYYKTCAPKGDIAELSEAIHGKSWWEHQQANIRGKREASEKILAEYPKISAEQDQLGRRIDEMIDRANAQALTPAEQQAAQLRRQADMIEALDQRRQIVAEVLENAAMLQLCEQRIENRIAGR